MNATFFKGRVFHLKQLGSLDDGSFLRLRRAGWGHYSGNFSLKKNGRKLTGSNRFQRRLQGSTQTQVTNPRYSFGSH